DAMVKCDYCGRDNADETQVCPGCGTSLVRGAASVAGGSVEVWPLIECAVGVAGLLGGHVFSLVHLAMGLSNLGPAHSPQSLLERAALLESVNMRAALALYEQIVLPHPGTNLPNE